MFSCYTVQCTSCVLQDDYGTLLITYAQSICPESDVRTVRILVQDQLLAGLDECVRIAHINKSLRETERYTGMNYSIVERRSFHPIFTFEEQAQIDSLSPDDIDEIYSHRANQQRIGYDENNNPIYAKTDLILA